MEFKFFSVDKQTTAKSDILNITIYYKDKIYFVENLEQATAHKIIKMLEFLDFEYSTI